MFSVGFLEPGVAEAVPQQGRGSMSLCISRHRGNRATGQHTGVDPGCVVAYLIKQLRAPCTTFLTLVGRVWTDIQWTELAVSTFHL